MKPVLPTISVIMRSSFFSLLLCTITLGKPHSHSHSHSHTHTKKYVIGVHHAGFFSALLGVLNHLVHCNNINKIPVVYWGSSSLYYLPGGFNGSHNVWEYYFEPVSHLAYKPNKDKVHASYGGEYAEFYYSALGQATRNKAYQIISQYIRIKPIVRAKIDTFYQEHMAGKRTIGIHLRGTDKFTEVKQVSVETIIDVARAQADQDTQFFVASDEQRLLDKAVDLLQGYKVIFYDCYRSNSDKPLHIKRDKPSFAQLGEDVLVEACLLARCDLLVHTLSNVSAGVLYWNPSLKNILLT